ncbi:hypothetical protein [Vibrio campbellii]|uniref:hypothetical protein n=1 Tax=Vibrio campbellii TaxID=680 RepID=UPI000CD36FBE|nr:hypothetical protein [Vibrio campbellii]AUW07680.1 hypothetical protein C1N51_29150 [Vibrio campbellii]
MINNNIERSNDNSIETEDELWVGTGELRRDNANKRGATLRKARKERERLLSNPPHGSQRLSLIAVVNDFGKITIQQMMFVTV